MPPESFPAEPVLEWPEPAESIQGFELFPYLTPWNKEQPAEKKYVLLYRQVLIQSETLRHVCKPLLDRKRIFLHIDAINRYASAVRDQDRRDHSEQGAFARAVRAHDAEYLAPVDREVQGIDGSDLPEALG